MRYSTAVTGMEKLIARLFLAVKLAFLLKDRNISIDSAFLSDFRTHLLLLRNLVRNEIVQFELQQTGFENVTVTCCRFCFTFYMANNNSSFVLLTNGADFSEQTRYYLATYYAVLSFFGLCLELAVLMTTVFQQKSNLTSFYIHLLNLGIADGVQFIIVLVYFVPCTVTSSQIYGSIIGSAFSFLAIGCFYSAIQNTFVISMNRFAMIVSKKFVSRFFTSSISKTVSIGTWLTSAMIILINYNLSCTPAFSERSYTFGTKCQNINMALSFGSFVAYGCVYGISVFYIGAFWKLWKKKKQIGSINNQASENMSKHQMNLFYQATGIWLATLIDVLGNVKKN